MPYYSFENTNNVMWFQFLDYYEDYVILKTDSEIKIGRVRTNWLFINATNIRPGTSIQFRYNLQSWGSSLTTPYVTVVFLDSLS